MWKKRTEASIGRLLFHTGLYRWYFRDRAVIVLFHRVDDRFKGNPISCSRAAFANFCDFFQRFFEVIPLTVLLDRLRRGLDIGGCLSITFDDGYSDNLTAAAPILIARKLPASFFITTGFIESDHIPWWDRKLGIRSEWMSWSQVTELSRLGFEIGSHTVNHADLGELHGSEAHTEICDSREVLEARLATSVQLFAYPYGGPHQITAANRDLVRHAGYRCCLSAFGGSVRSGDDPYFLKREAISNWQISPYQFGFELLRRGWTQLRIPPSRPQPTVADHR